MSKIIKYDKNLLIDNLSSLPSGTGAKYLECITSPDESRLIAKQWRKVKPKYFSVLIDFTK